MQLTFLHTNDLHGHLEELTRLVTAARRLRAEVEAAGGHCLQVDCGDSEDRTVLEMAVTKGLAAAIYLAAASYDLAAVGNGAALSFGPQVIAPMAEAAGFPLLCANLLEADGNLVAGCTPSVLRVLGGVRVGLIGLAPHWHYWTLFGLQNPDPVPIVEQEMQRLREQGATVLVLLSHLGLAEDLQLLGRVRGIDLILGGHSHTTIFAGLIQGQTLVAQAGDYGRFLGRVDLEIDDASGQVVERRATLIPVSMEEEPDPALVAAIQKQRTVVEGLLAEPLGRLTGELAFDPIDESPAGNLLADCVRARTGADVVLCQPTHLLAGLPAGIVTLADLYQACKSPGNPAWRWLTGAQLLEMLEAGLDSARAEVTAPWGRGRPNGRMAVSAMTATYDPAAARGERLRDVQVAGQPLDPQQTYQVAGSDAEMTDLAWRDSSGHSLLSFALAEEDACFEVPIVLREVLEAYLRDHSPVVPPATGRIHMVAAHRAAR